MLRAAYSKSEHRARLAAIRPHFTDIATRRAETFDSLFKVYNRFLEEFLPLLETTQALNTEIRRFNSETSGLREVKQISTVAETLLERLVLASETSTWWPDPKAANAFAVQWGEALGRTYTSSPLRQAASSPDWAAARAIQDEAKEAEWAGINGLQERQQAEAKREFEQSKKVAR